MTAIDVSLLLFVIGLQVGLRILYSFRLYPDCDYCTYSLYDVTVESGGKAGRDFEICWGVKVASVVFCRWARRWLPFGVYSPRVALAAWHAAVSVAVYALTLELSGSGELALLATAIYATTSSLVHSGTYVASPENFDAGALVFVAFCFVAPSVASAIAAAAVLAFMVSCSKVPNLLHAGPVALLFYLAGGGWLALDFLLAFAGFLAVSLAVYALGKDNRSLRETYGEAMRYVARTATGERAKPGIAQFFVVQFGWANCRELWASFLREVPVLMVGLLCWPLYRDADGALALLALALGAIGVALAQNKLWRLHFYPCLGVTSVMCGMLAAEGEVWLALVGLSWLVTLYHLGRAAAQPSGALSRYYWDEPLGVSHHYSDAASAEAAEFIREQSPELGRVFVWGMQIQLYTLLGRPGPPSIPYFARETLWYAWRRRKIVEWLEQEPPEWIFYPDAQFRYFPVYLLEGLIGKRYELAAQFGKLGFPLYRCTGEDVPAAQRILAREVGLHPELGQFGDRFSSKETCSLERLEAVLGQIQAAGVRRLVLYGLPATADLERRCSDAGIRITGRIQTQACDEPGVWSAAAFDWDLPDDCAVLITARSHQSVAEIRERVRKSSAHIPVFALVDQARVARWLREQSSDSPIVVYGLGRAGRYLLEIGREAGVENLLFHDGGESVGPVPRASSASLLEGDGYVFLGVAPHTNDEIFFELLARGVRPERIVDFDAIFGLSRLPGRFGTFVEELRGVLSIEGADIVGRLDGEGGDSLLGHLARALVCSGDGLVEPDHAAVSDVLVAEGGRSFEKRESQHDIGWFE